MRGCHAGLFIQAVVHDFPRICSQLETSFSEARRPKARSTQAHIGKNGLPYNDYCRFTVFIFGCNTCFAFSRVQRSRPKLYPFRKQDFQPTASKLLRLAEYGCRFIGRYFEGLSELLFIFRIQNIFQHPEIDMIQKVIPYRRSQNPSWPIVI